MSITSDANAVTVVRRTLPAITVELSGEAQLQAYEAQTFFSRLRGLHAVWPLLADEALIIRPCNAIHTMSMPCAIDVVFVDKAGVVVQLETVPRFRFRRCAKASAVLEMSTGTIKRLGIEVGSVLTRQQGTWR